jgi:fibronectin type 3 domain-containing protein
MNGSDSRLCAIYGAVVTLCLLFAPGAHAQAISYTEFNAGPAAPVLTGGGSGAWDEFIREKVQIVEEGGLFRMWYVGHSAAGQETSKVGYATSTDGVNWIKYAGNPVISRSSSDQDISLVVMADGSYRMYIEVNNLYIDLLLSADGIHWTPSSANPVKTVAASPVVWQEGGSWYMLYEHMAGATLDIWLATSPDGLVWTDSVANPVISATAFTAPDSILKDGSTYHLYYHTANNGMWHATSTNLVNWANHQLLISDQSLTSPFVFRTNGGEIWAYLWADDGSQRIYHRRGAPLNYPLAWAFDEGSGTTANGRGFQVNATLMNGASWTTGPVGGAVSLDGVNDYVSTTFTQNLANWTIASWVRSPAAPANGPASGPVHREANYQIVWNHGDAQFRGAAAMRVGGRWYSASFGPLSGNVWYHLAATYDGETLRTYRDGVLITSNTSPSGPPDAESRALLFGRHVARDQYFAGAIDDVYIYNRALSGPEIAALMSQGLDATPPSAPTGLLTSVSGQTVSLFWSPAGDPESGISQYRVYRGTTAGGPKSVLGFVGGGSLGAVDPSGAASTTYYYQVSAVNGTGLEGPRSGEASALTGDVPPAAPTGLTATVSGGNVTLDWADNAEQDLAGYRVFRSSTSGGPYAPIGPALVSGSSYTDTGLAQGSTSYYVVSAVDAGGFESSRSAQVSATIPIPSSATWHWRLDEGSGTVAVDAGRGMNGTLQNGPVWTSGVFGGGLSFDGVNDYISTSFTQDVPSWTIAVWVRSPAAPGNGPSSGPIQRETNFQIVWNHPEASFRGVAALRVAGRWHAASFGALAANTWYRLVATYDGETLRAYRDGVLVTSNASPSGPPDAESRPLLFGRNTVRDQFFGGVVDDIRIYDRALDATEVAALMSN